MPKRGQHRVYSCRFLTAKPSGLIFVFNSKARYHTITRRQYSYSHGRVISFSYTHAGITEENRRGEYSLKFSKERKEILNISCCLARG